MQSKEEFWEAAGFVSELMPVVVRCDTDAWKSYFDDYTLMDAVLISRSNLLGTDYQKRTYFKPAWLEDAEKTNILVLTNLDQLPVNSNDPAEKTQVDFSHLIRMKDEPDAYRELNFGSDIFVPADLQVFIVLPCDYAFDPFFASRCALIEIDP